MLTHNIQCLSFRLLTHQSYCRHNISLVRQRTLCSYFTILHTYLDWMEMKYHFIVTNPALWVMLVGCSAMGQHYCSWSIITYRIERKTWRPVPAGLLSHICAWLKNKKNCVLFLTWLLAIRIFCFWLCSAHRITTSRKAGLLLGSLQILE